MNIRVGSVIQYFSAGGCIRGTVESITHSPSAARTIEPWLTIVGMNLSTKRPIRINICGNDRYLRMMNVVVVK